MSDHGVDETVARLATTQEALWSRAQARGAGASRSLVRRRVASGRWIDHGHGVYGPPGVPWNHRRRLWAGHLAVGPASVVSHEAAAELHGFTGYQNGAVVLTRPHSGHSAFPAMTVHQITDCADHHKVRIAGLPTTSPARTFIDLGAVSSHARLRHSLEDAVSARTVSLGEVAAVLQEVTRRGKPGVARLLTVLDDQVGAPPPTSELERRVRSMLVAAGLPDPQRQRPLPGRGAVNGLVDFLFPEARLIVEADGRRWHDRRRNMLLDRDRDNEAAAAGHQTLRVMWERVTTDTAATGQVIATTYRQRRRLLAAAA
jgi:very-short-patch-repair endonuclease